MSTTANMTATANMSTTAKRQCGHCQLCCKLLPVKDIAKPAATRCQHQRFHKGCGIYANRPLSCRIWNCRWLVSDDTADLDRPDRSHYVIDMMPDVVKAVDNETGETHDLTVVQIWVDPKYPTAHHDPALRAFLARRALEGIAALIRYNSVDSIALFAPSFMNDGEWHEIGANFNPNMRNPYDK